jgi:hypothetical protein
VVVGEQRAVLEYFVERVQRNGRIELAATYGSFGTDACTDSSDVDIFFVPGTDAGRAAALQVIVDDIGYDLWSLEWTRLEQIAELTDPLTAVLLDSTVVFGSDPARRQLERLRSLCRANLRDPAQRVAAARRLLDAAASAVGRGERGDLAQHASAVTSLLTGWAFLEGAYLGSGAGRIIGEGAPWLPEVLRASCAEALTTHDAARRGQALSEALRIADERLAGELSALAKAVPPAERSARLEGGYEELHSALKKLLRTSGSATATLAAAGATHEGGSMLHFLDTGGWPTDPDQARQAWEAHGMPDLLGALWDPQALVAAVEDAMRRLPAALEGAGVRIRRVAKASDLP